MAEKTTHGIAKSSHLDAKCFHAPLRVQPFVRKPKVKKTKVPPTASNAEHHKKSLPNFLSSKLSISLASLHNALGMGVAYATSRERSEHLAPTG